MNIAYRTWAQHGWSPELTQLNAAQDCVSGIGGCKASACALHHAGAPLLAGKNVPRRLFAAAHLKACLGPDFDGEAPALKRITACRIKAGKPFDPQDLTHVIKTVSHPGIQDGDPFLLMEALREIGGAELVLLCRLQHEFSWSRV